MGAASKWEDGLFTQIDSSRHHCITASHHEKGWSTANIVSAPTEGGGEWGECWLSLWRESTRIGGASCCVAREGVPSAPKAN